MLRMVLTLALLLGCGDDDTAGRDASFPEACNGIDDDSDGVIDEGAELQCSARNVATATCGGTAGCQVAACVPGTADCNGEFADGCEGTFGCMDAGVDADLDSTVAPPTEVMLGFSVSDLGGWAEGRALGAREVVAGDACNFLVFDTTLGVVLCGSAAGEFPIDVPFEVVTQEGGMGPSQTFGVFLVPNLDASDGDIAVRGERPLVIISQGPIVVGARMRVPNSAGGWPGVNTMSTRGEGPGGGYYAEGNFDDGGEGSSYCTLGQLSDDQDGSDMRGVTYGTPENIPLLGGSSGGSEGAFDDSGDGGAAVILVSAESITIETTGSITLDGALGSDGGGGGSGGALILEAPLVEVDGTLSAVGGMALSPGGDGGDGRLRINATDSDIAFDALLMPMLGSECVSTGALLPLVAPPVVPGCAAAATEVGRCAACVAVHCCDGATACAADSVCAACRASPEPGPGCVANTTLTGFETCLRDLCPDACRDTLE